ncbi:hypothetical protein [Ligilactobacillus sp. LYQ60]|uniref:hypothetical protein n=1 Tax=Ligilactobacillus sp. LYQ60 TaxID=3378799 RepID=UPI00385302E8
MKKSIALSIVLLASLGLAGCGGSTHHTTGHHPKTHKSSSKISSSSSKSSSSSSSSSLSSQVKQQATGKQQPANKQAVVRNTQPQNQPATANNLHDFVNRYGMSPAAYKMQHDGMTAQQALDATPDNLKTTGELQLQHSMEQGN